MRISTSPSAVHAGEGTARSQPALHPGSVQEGAGAHA
jgi:hypothetical protein